MRDEDGDIVTQMLMEPIYHAQLKIKVTVTDYFSIIAASC